MKLQEGIWYSLDSGWSFRIVKIGKVYASEVYDEDNEFIFYICRPVKTKKDVEEFITIFNKGMECGKKLGKLEKTFEIKRILDIKE